MSDSSENSIRDTESRISQDSNRTSLFGKIFSHFSNRRQNRKNNRERPNKSNSYDDSRDKIAGSNKINYGKVLKLPISDRSTINTKQLVEELQKNENSGEMNLNRERLKAPIKAPVLDSLELDDKNIQKPSQFVSSNVSPKVTNEGRREIKPHVIQLGQRRAIRINPNSSTSSASLSPPSVSLTTPVISPSISEAKTSSFYEILHRDGISSPAQHFPIPNTSTPHRSHSHMISVNTIDDLEEEPTIARVQLGEPEEFIYNMNQNNTTSIEKTANEELECTMKKERKKKKKKSRDGHKRKKKREMLREEINKSVRPSYGFDGQEISAKVDGHDLCNVQETRHLSYNNNIHNPFQTTKHDVDIIEDIINSQNVSVMQSQISFEDKGDQGNMDFENGQIINNDNLRIAQEESCNAQHPMVLELPNPNLILKEDNTISKLFLSSDVDSEEDKLILGYRNKKQPSELKWPGHDSVGEIHLPQETAKKKASKNKEIVSDNGTTSNKPRLLSDIMAEMYKKDGISFLGKFKTYHLPSVHDDSSDDSNSIDENGRESPVIKKFGVDVRKERLRREGKLVD